MQCSDVAEEKEESDRQCDDGSSAFVFSDF
jgi:hypothetical protein